jgi:type IV secretion system protein TrbD
MSALRLTPLRRALWRHNLVLGGERELVLLTALSCASVALLAAKILFIIGAGVVWAICIAPLRLMAKADPQMSRVYLRFIQYQHFYPARSRPARGSR